MNALSLEQGYRSGADACQNMRRAVRAVSVGGATAKKIGRFNEAIDLHDIGAIRQDQFKPCRGRGLDVAEELGGASVVARGIHRDASLPIHEDDADVVRIIGERDIPLPAEGELRFSHRREGEKQRQEKKPHVVEGFT